MDETNLRMYKAKSNGRMSAEEVLTGRVQNLLPHVTTAQRKLGHFNYEKAWWLIEDDDDGVGVDPETYIDFPTLSDDDFVVFFAMEARTAIEDITGYSTGNDAETKVGTGYLIDDIAAGAFTFNVRVKNAAMAVGPDSIYRDGGTIKITDKASDTSTTGNEDTLTLNGIPVIGGDGISITLTVTTAVVNDYIADGVSRARSIIEPDSDMETSLNSYNVTSAGDGDYDNVEYKIKLDNIGTVDEDWTIVFTDSTHFRLDGDSLGNGVSTGTTASDFSPLNGDKSRPYFTMYAAGFDGTWQAGDTITFTTNPAAMAIGVKRVVPPLSGSLANNRVGAVLVVEAGSSSL